MWDYLFSEWSQMYKNILKVHSIHELENTFRSRFSDLTKFPSGYVILDDDDTFVGFGALEYNKAFEKHDLLKSKEMIWLTNLYIKAEHRRKGVSKWFIEQIGNILQQKKINNLVVWTNKQNLVPFYEKIGFEKIEKQKCEGYSFDVFHKYITPPESPIQPVHIIGFIVIVFILYVIRLIWQYFLDSLVIHHPL